MTQSTAEHLSRKAYNSLPLLDQILSDDDSADGGDSSLDDAAVTERDYVRGKLKEELNRDPTDEEIDEWLRQHTEGY